MAELVCDAPSAVDSKARQRPWPLPLRIAFRFVFCYFTQFAFASGHKTILEKIPGGHHAVQSLAERPYLLTSAWLARHVFHLTGMAAIPHPSGFADRALDWIAAGLMLVLAAIATAVWSGLDRRRLNYDVLFTWLRFLLRLTLVVAMLWYGSIKIFPIQIEHPSLAVLNEPVGNTSPLTLLWTLLGSNPLYEQLCGAVETLCALLLIYRRTALAGALLSAFVLSNIVLFDLFFDVPVKLYAANLLLMSLVILAPDLHALLAFFWSKRPTVLTSLWTPAAQSSNGRYALLAVECIFLLVAIKPFFSHAQYTHEQASVRNPSPLAGQWHLDRAEPAAPYLTPGGQPMTDLFLEPSGRDTVRAADDTLFPGGTYDGQAGVITLLTPMQTLASYRIMQPDSSHLILQPGTTGDPALYLTRIPIPMHFRLFDRKPQLVSEWGFER